MRITLHVGVDCLAQFRDPEGDVFLLPGQGFAPYTGLTVPGNGDLCNRIYTGPNINDLLDCEIPGPPPGDRYVDISDSGNGGSIDPPSDGGGGNNGSQSTSSSSSSSSSASSASSRSSASSMGSSSSASSGSVASSASSASASSASSASASSASSSSSSGTCGLTYMNVVIVNENEVTFVLDNNGDLPVEIEDMGFSEATPTFSPEAPFTLTAGAGILVTMTTALPNTGGYITIFNDCNGDFQIQL